MKQSVKRARTKAEEAQELLDRLVDLDLESGVKLRAMQLIDRLKLPMATVLAKVPGDSVVEKARILRISRQTYYSWLRGASRPNERQARIISDWTDIPWEDIQGRTRLSPRRLPLVPATLSPSGSV